MADKVNKKKKKTKHRRKGSGASIVSIDPYSLSLLKRASSHTRSMKTESHLLPKLPNINNATLSPNYKNPITAQRLSQGKPVITYKEEEEEELNEIYKQKQKLMSEEEVLISMEELRPMLEKIALELEDLRHENKDFQNEIEKLHIERQKLLSDYQKEVSILESDLKFQKQQIDELTSSNDIKTIQQQLENNYNEQLLILKDMSDKERKKLEKENYQLRIQLEQSYATQNQLRKSLDISEDNLNQQINELHQKAIKFKMIQKENKSLKNENSLLKETINNFQNDMEDMANFNVPQTEPQLQAQQMHDFLDELGGKQRESVEMNTDTVRRIRGNSGDGSIIQGGTINLEEQIYNDEILNAPDQYDSDQKTEEEKKNQDNESLHIPKDANAPQSWKQIEQNLKKKETTSSGKASMQSIPTDSQINLEQKIDDIEEEIRLLKETVMQVLDETQNISPDIQNSLNPLKRQINRMFLLLTGDHSIPESKTDEISETSESASENGNKKNKKRKSIEEDTGTSWFSWLTGDLGHAKLNPKKRSLVEEWAPSFGFSVVILSVLYLIHKYRKGDITFGQPQVLRKNGKSTF